MASLSVASTIISCQVRSCLSYSQICWIFSRRSTVSEDAFRGRPLGLPDLPFSNGRPGPRPFNVRLSRIGFGFSDGGCGCPRNNFPARHCLCNSLGSRLRNAVTRHFVEQNV